MNFGLKPQEGEEYHDLLCHAEYGATKPNQRILEFSGDWTNTVDFFVVAVQEPAEEFRWLVVSCSPPASGGEHVVFGKKLKIKILEQRERFGSHGD
jgi:hypothetical protein